MGEVERRDSHFGAQSGEIITCSLSHVLRFRGSETVEFAWR